MRHRIYNYRVDYACTSISQTKSCIKKFLKSALITIGLKKDTDFKVTTSCLFIYYSTEAIVKRITKSLRNTFPVFNFYWETSRCLVWF